MVIYFTLYVHTFLIGILYFNICTMMICKIKEANVGIYQVNIRDMMMKQRKKSDQ